MAQTIECVILLNSIMLQRLSHKSTRTNQCMKSNRMIKIGKNNAAEEKSFYCSNIASQ